MDGYSHTQKSPLCLIVYGAAIALFVGAWTTRDKDAVALILRIGGLVTCLIGMAFHHLTVEDLGDRLAIRFGPLPLFHRKIKYADIVKFEVGRTWILEGWGIHYSLRGGWVWNIWGRKCVVIRFNNGGALRIGTDDAENLARFLEGKIGPK